MIARLDIRVPGHQRIRLLLLLDHRLWPKIWTILSKEMSSYVVPFEGLTNAEIIVLFERIQMLYKGKLTNEKGKTSKLNDRREGLDEVDGSDKKEAQGLACQNGVTQRSEIVKGKDCDSFVLATIEECSRFATP